MRVFRLKLGLFVTLAVGAALVIYRPFRMPRLTAVAEESRLGPQHVWVLHVERRVGNARDPASVLTAVADMTVGRDSAIYVVQPLDRTVRVFGPQGDVRMLIGRCGSGPGEFANPTRAGWLGDTLWIADRSLNRFSFFAASGAHLETVSPPAPRGVGRSVAPAPAGVMAGSWFLMQERVPGLEMMTTGRRVETLIATDRNGEAASVLAELSIAHSRFAVVHPERPFNGLFGAQPFTDDPLWDMHPAGQYVVVVERAAAPAEARSASYRVHWISSSGDTLRSVAHSYVPQPLSEATYDSVFDEETAAVLQARGPGIESLREAESAVRAALYRPAHWPRFSSVTVARDGSIWLERSRAGHELAYDVLSEDGTWIATANVPGRMRIFDRFGGSCIRGRDRQS